MNFGYHVFTKKEYYKTLKDTFPYDEILNIGYYEKNNGTTGEFSLNFNIEDGKFKITSTVYSDGYNAFVEFLKALQNVEIDENITPEIIIKNLNKYGAVDFT